MIYFSPMKLDENPHTHFFHVSRLYSGTIFATTPPIVTFFQSSNSFICCPTYKSVWKRMWKSQLLAGVRQSLFWLSPNETNKNYIEKQNKGTGKGGALVIKGCAWDCATATTSSVPMMKRIYSTVAIVSSPPWQTTRAGMKRSSVTEVLFSFIPAHPHYWRPPH